MEILTRALCGVVLTTVVMAGSPSFAATSIGEKTPAVTLSTLAGEEVDLEDMRGEVVVLDFWATWCPPCVAQLEALNEYLKDNENSGVDVLAATIDDDLAAVAAYLERKFPGARFRVVHDPGSAALAEFGADGIPALYVIGPDGVVRHSHFGPGGGAGLAEIVETLSGKGGPSALEGRVVE